MPSRRIQYASRQHQFSSVPSSARSGHTLESIVGKFFCTTSMHMNGDMSPPSGVPGILQCLQCQHSRGYILHTEWYRWHEMFGHTEPCFYAVFGMKLSDFYGGGLESWEGVNWRSFLYIWCCLYTASLNPHLFEGCMIISSEELMQWKRRRKSSEHQLRFNSAIKSSFNSSHQVEKTYRQPTRFGLVNNP